MKKASIEVILLLSSIYNRKQLSDLFKEIRSLEVDQLETVLARLEEYKAKSFGIASEAIETALEQKRIQLEKRLEQDRIELEKKHQISGTAQEITHLLLNRYKLKVPAAAKQLSEELARRGRSSTAGHEGSTKASFTKWLSQLCEDMPREDVMSAALNLTTK